MIQFHETYCDNVIVAPLVRQISWTNNIVIFSHQSSIEEKEFYIRLCIKNNYSKRELERQIASHYYERYMLLGYGSKYQLLRMLGWHRNEFNKAICDCLSISGGINWLDFKFN